MIETKTARQVINSIKRLLESSVEIDGRTYYFYRDVEMLLPTEDDITMIQGEAIQDWLTTEL